jgi:hypothetical protein
MSGDAVIDRATRLYVEGRIDFPTLDRWIAKGVRAGQREVPEAIVYLPLPTYGL